MKREVVILTSTVVLSTILVFCFQSTAVQAAALKTGAPCKKLGATQLNKVDTYKCVLRNKKHVWTIAYRAPIAKSPQPLPLTPTYSCTSAPDVPAITVTA